MTIRLANLFLLVSLLALPLYGARTHMQRPAPAASTDEEHRADLARLAVLPHAEYLVAGQGAPRSDYGDCNRDIPVFIKTLASKGLTVVETVTCVPVEGDREAYAPAFRATAAEDLAPALVTGGRYNSYSFCELEAQRMLVDLAKKGRQTVLESSCKRVKGTELGGSSDDLYEPSAVVLAVAKRAEPTRQYSSIEALANPVKSE
ncbi:MAG: hypothetical protein HY075_11915 [Deltaproteobacteria bacterium]|nr:hypothetical protein [Deltaproteobacteria bacterium]